jgi:hypothetical protein
MDDPKSRDEELNKLIKARHAYGAEFTVFVPQQQPAASTWNPDVEQLDEKGRVNHHYLKHGSSSPRQKTSSRTPRYPLSFSRSIYLCSRVFLYDYLSVYEYGYKSPSTGIDS